MERVTQALRRAALALGFFSIAGLAAAAGAATVLVKAGDGTPDAGGCGDKANPCDTIQAGVDNAVTGDVVNVGPGDYPENVVVSTPGVTLLGKGTLRGAPDTVCPGDPTRTVLARCSDLGTQPECEAAWHLTGDTEPPYAASCYWDGGSCRGCGPNNEGDGLCTNTCTPVPPAALLIEANDVRVEKLRVRGPRFGGVTVLPAVQNTSLQALRIEGAGGPCVAGLGAGLSVGRSSLRSCADACLLASGDDARIERNRLLSCGEHGIRTGAGAFVARNSVRLAGDHCVSFRGDGATIERNQLSLCDGEGVDGFGSGATLARNQIRDSFDGIFYECRTVASTCADPARTDFVGGPDSNACRSLSDQPACEAAWHIGNGGAASCFWDGAECRGCGPNNEDGGDCTNTCLPAGDRCTGVASGNRVTDVIGDCLDVFARDSGLVVEGNRLAGCEDEGIELAGVGIEARGNSVTECGTDDEDHGVVVEEEAEDVLVEGTSVRGCSGDGFNVGEAALGTTLIGNTAIDNGQDGFDVESGATGTVIDRARAQSNIEGGIEVSSGAVDTSVTGSKATGNALDFCDEGTNTTETGNQFGTTSTPCIPDTPQSDGGII